jgi:hypothetical protein
MVIVHKRTDGSLELFELVPTSDDELFYVDERIGSGGRCTIYHLAARQATVCEYCGDDIEISEGEFTTA